MFPQMRNNNQDISRPNQDITCRIMMPQPQNNMDTHPQMPLKKRGMHAMFPSPPPHPIHFAKRARCMPNSEARKSCRSVSPTSTPSLVSISNPVQSKEASTALTVALRYHNNSIEQWHVAKKAREEALEAVARAKETLLRATMKADRAELEYIKASREREESGRFLQSEDARRMIGQSTRTSLSVASSPPSSVCGSCSDDELSTVTAASSVTPSSSSDTDSVGSNDMESPVAAPKVVLRNSAVFKLAPPMAPFRSTTPPHPISPSPPRSPSKPDSLMLLSSVAEVSRKGCVDKIDDGISGNYVGELNSKGQRHGRGTMRYTNGETYEGQFVSDKKEGQGRFHARNSGETYEGHFVNDKRDGYGVSKWVDNTSYEGSWKNGLFEGQGAMVEKDGSIYKGQWKEAKRHGRGILVYAAGDVYDGEFADGLRNGRGTYYWTNGRVDVCLYKEHRIVGVGAQWSPCRRRAYRLLDGCEQGKMSLKEAAEIAKSIGLPVPKKNAADMRF